MSGFASALLAIVASPSCSLLWPVWFNSKSNGRLRPGLVIFEPFNRVGDNPVWWGAKNKGDERLSNRMNSCRARERLSEWERLITKKYKIYKCICIHPLLCALWNLPPVSARVRVRCACLCARLFASSASDSCSLRRAGTMNTADERKRRRQTCEKMRKQSTSFRSALIVQPTFTQFQHQNHTLT